MKCAYCGNEFEGKFCPQCGTPARNVCPRCGARVNGKFCPECGAAVAAPAATPVFAAAPAPQSTQAAPASPPPISGRSVLRCPRCGGSDISFEREQGATLNGSSVKLPKRGKRRVYGVGASGNFYGTTAVCRGCGNSWHVKSDKELKRNKILKGVLIFFGVLLVMSMVRQWSSTGDKGKAASTASQAARASNAWAAVATPLTDFQYTLADGVLRLNHYTGSANKLRIAGEYEVDGTVYPVDLEDFYLNRNCESVILEEGITSIEVAAFNGVDVQRLYIPASMSVLYDATLAYVDFSLKEIFYGGSEEQWNAIYQHYDPGTFSEKIDEGNYEDAGAALANDLNEKMRSNDVDLSTKQLVFNASIDELK